MTTAAASVSDLRIEHPTSPTVPRGRYTASAVFGFGGELGNEPPGSKAMRDHFELGLDHEDFGITRV